MCGDVGVIRIQDYNEMQTDWIQRETALVVQHTFIQCVCVCAGMAVCITVLLKKKNKVMYQGDFFFITVLQHSGEPQETAKFSKKETEPCLVNAHNTPTFNFPLNLFPEIYWVSYTSSSCTARVTILPAHAVMVCHGKLSVYFLWQRLSQLLPCKGKP